MFEIIGKLVLTIEQMQASSLTGPRVWRSKRPCRHATSVANFLLKPLGIRQK